MQQSPYMMGWLFFSGATWVTLALGPARVQGTLYLPVAVWGAVIAAYVVGLLLLWMGFTQRELPERLAHLGVALGTLAATAAALGSGPIWIGAVGGFYGYVAAYAFLHFSRRAAAAHLVFAGLCYGLAVPIVGIAHPAAMWLLVVGIAAGGAGLVGAVAQRLREGLQVEQEAAASMRRADQMRSTFLQAVSHELRTPLTAVTGFASTLRQHGDRLSPDARGDLQDRLHGAAQRLERLLEDLLDIERIERDGATASREPVHLPTLVVTAVDLVAAGEAQVRVSADDVEVWLEPAKVERVIVNLVANALKHNAYGSNVEIGATVDGTGAVELRVVDHGVGIAPEIRATLFEPFVQGPDSSAMAQPGTGIGLTLVDRFARMHDGDVHVEPTPGGGATFVVRLPATPPPSGPPTPRTGTPPRSQPTPPAPRVPTLAS